MTNLVNNLGLDKPLVFVHIPKTGGLTLRAILANFYDYNAICPLADWDAIVERRLNPAYYQLFNGHFPYNIQDWLPQTPRYITMLREPVERVISQYHHEKREESAGMYSLVSGRDLSLDEFLDHPTALAGSQNWQTAYIAAPPIEDLYAQWCDFRDKLLTEDLPTVARYPSLGLNVAQERLQDFAFVGLTDRFTESVMLLYYKFGWFPVLDFPSYNVKVGRRYRDELDSSLVDKIETLHADDVQLYAQGQAIFEAEFATMRHNLVEQYGSAEDAHQVPDINRLGELLHQNYQARYAERHQPTHHYRFNMHHALDGQGWHPSEMHAEYGGVRWTGSQNHSVIDLPVQYEGDLVLSCRILMALEDDILESLQLSANGHPLDYTQHISPDEALLLRAIIPAEYQQADAPFLRIEFAVNRTIQPHPNDPRQVGVLVHWLDIEPLKIIPAENRGQLMTIDKSTKQSTFFMHIPSTVDLSFFVVLENQHKADSIYQPASLATWQADGAPQLTNHAYVRGHFSYDWAEQTLAQPMHFLTMLSEPEQRCIQHILQQQNQPDFPNTPANFSELSFAEIVDTPELSQYFANHQTALLAGDELSLDLAQERLATAQFIGLVEQMQESLFLLAYQSNSMPVWKHEHWSMMESRPSIASLAPETRAKIQELNQLDAELYAFAEKQFSEHYTAMGDALLTEYGSTEQANLSHPLPHQVVYELLERKFRAEVMQHTPPSSAIYYDFGEVMHGAGWHWREGDAHRWMCEKQATLILPNLTSDTALLRLHVLQAVTTEILASLQIYVNDIPIKTVRRRTNDDRYIIDGLVSTEVLSANPYYNSLRLAISQTQCLPDSEDKRELGIVVAQIDLVPAEFAEITETLVGWQLARHNWEATRIALNERVTALEGYSASLNEELGNYQEIVRASETEITALQDEIMKYQVELQTAEEYVHSLSHNFQETQIYAVSLKQELDKVMTEFKKAEEYALSLKHELDRFRR